MRALQNLLQKDGLELLGGIVDLRRIVGLAGFGSDSRERRDY
jgi:hypothetical protein